MDRQTSAGMKTYSDLLQKLDRLAGVSILCVGDVMLDHFVYGEVTRVSPEAPVPVLDIQREESMLGGAGNVVRNLCSLGAQVSFAACVGSDSGAAEVSAHLGALPNCRPSLVIEQDRRTTVKRRYLSHGQQLLRADRETAKSIGAAAQKELLEYYLEALPACQAVVLSDYGKGVLSDDNTQSLVTAAVRAGRQIVVDPKGRSYLRYHGASLIKPNTRELAEATGLNVESPQEATAAAQVILRETGAGAVVVTRGPAGMMLVENDRILAFPSQAREVFDVSGAGDTVAAVLAIAMGAGLFTEEAVFLANIAAGLVVAKVGTAVVTVDDIRSEL